MDRKPFIYNPDECFDLGGAGEYPIQITALIDEDSIHGKTFRSVNIVRAIVTTDVPDEHGNPVSLDVTKKIIASPYSRERWEQDIYSAYRRKAEKEWSEVS